MRGYDAREKYCYCSSEDKWYEGLTVDIQDKWAYIYFADESCRKILRRSNKSTQIYPGLTVHDALTERRRNNISREGLTAATKAAIQAEYDAHPLDTVAGVSGTTGAAE